MAKGIVLVELDIEKQIINDLTKVEGLLVHLPTIQANLTDSLRRLHEVLV
ncbi:MAG: hypothetical protein NTY99_02600 [DPANN group archaeon]|nr:hypothetical protein [DPANN group archaeon]